MTQYLAIITRQAIGRTFEVSFPACPGCVTVGDTLVEALGHAREAIEGWVETSVEAGDRLPPSDIEADVTRHLKRGAFVTLIAIEPATPRVVPVTFTIREDQLRQIDSRAKELGVSRSAFLAQSATGAASAATVWSPVPPGPLRGLQEAGVAFSGPGKIRNRSSRSRATRAAKGAAKATATAAARLDRATARSSGGDKQKGRGRGAQRTTPDRP